MANVQRFPYRLVQNAHGELALRPQLPLALSYRGQEYSGDGLVDSGADVSVLPYSVGMQPGAIWEEQTTGVELSGNLANYEARGIILSATIGQLASARLVFAWTRTEHVPLILGQTNFFMEFDVCFFRSQSMFEVRPKGNP